MKLLFYKNWPYIFQELIERFQRKLSYKIIRNFFVNAFSCYLKINENLNGLNEYPVVFFSLVWYWLVGSGLLQSGWLKHRSRFPLWFLMLFICLYVGTNGCMYTFDTVSNVKFTPPHTHFLIYSFMCMCPGHFPLLSRINEFTMTNLHTHTHINTAVYICVLYVCT